MKLSKKNKPRDIKPAEKREPKKHAERLHVDMPFDEFISRLIRVKPDKNALAWKKAKAKE